MYTTIATWYVQKGQRTKAVTALKELARKVQEKEEDHEEKARRLKIVDGF